MFLNPFLYRHGMLSNWHAGMNVLDTIGLVSYSFGQWMSVPGDDHAERMDEERFRYTRLEFQGDRLVDTFQTFVNPGRAIPEFFYEAFRRNENLHQNRTSSFLLYNGKPLSYLFSKIQTVSSSKPAKAWEKMTKQQPPQ